MIEIVLTLGGIRVSSLCERVTSVATRLKKGAHFQVLSRLTPIEGTRKGDSKVDVSGGSERLRIARIPLGGYCPLS